MKTQENKNLELQAAKTDGNATRKPCFDPTLKDRADFNTQLNKSNAVNSQLWEAATKGDISSCLWILQCHTQITQKAKDYALHKAAQSGHTETCKALMEQGADPHSVSDSPFRVAAENGHIETATFFLANKADIQAFENYAIRGAAENNHTETCKFLLARHPNPHNIIKHPDMPELAKTLAKKEQNRRAAQKLKKPQPSLEI